VITALRVNT